MREMVLGLLEEQQSRLFWTSLVECHACLHHALGPGTYVPIRDAFEPNDEISLPRLAGTPVCNEINGADSSPKREEGSVPLAA